MAKITEKEIATQAVAREDRLAATAKTTGVEKAYLKVAKTAPNRRRIAAAQALDGLVPLLTPAEGVAWIEQSRAWLNQELDEPLFLNLSMHGLGNQAFGRDAQASVQSADHG